MLKHTPHHQLTHVYMDISESSLREESAPPLGAPERSIKQDDARRRTDERIYQQRVQIGRHECDDVSRPRWCRTRPHVDGAEERPVGSAPLLHHVRGGPIPSPRAPRLGHGEVGGAVGRQAVKALTEKAGFVIQGGDGGRLRAAEVPEARDSRNTSTCWPSGAHDVFISSYPQYWSGEANDEV